MATPVLRGTLQPQLQKWVGKYSPTSGFTYEQEFKGLSAELMQIVANDYANTGCSYTLTSQFGVATLATEDTRGNITLDTWEIGVSQTLISIFKNPLTIASMSAVELAFLAWTYEIGNNADATEEAFNASYTGQTYGGSFTLPSVSSSSAFWRLYERIFVFKEDSAFFDQYTLRHTTNVSNRYPSNIADTNKNCIYTPAQFYAEVQSTDYWLFPMPQAFVNVLASNTAPTPPGSSTMNYGKYLWGYLKGGSPRTTAANNRSNIVTEYKQFLWSTDTYGTI